MTLSVSSQIPGLRTAGIGVHVRTIHDAGQILACYPSTALRACAESVEGTSLTVAHIQLYNGRRQGNPAWQAYNEAWEKAEALKFYSLSFLI